MATETTSKTDSLVIDMDDIGGTPSMEISIHDGDCSLATTLAAGRMMLQSAPLLSSCMVKVIADTGVFVVGLKLEHDGRITEWYEAYKFKQKII
jgi:hypothetical protein